jgi:hypothetical protein
VPAPNLETNHVGEEYDVSRYINLFTQPLKRGGIKRNPADVMVVGLDGPPSPVEIIAATRTSGLGTAPQPAYVTCSPVDGMNCLVKVQHACQNTVQPAFFADPAVRVHAVVDAAHGFEASICGDDLTSAPDFSGVLTEVAQRIGSSFGACIPAPLTDRDHPDCVVGDVTIDDDGNEHVTAIPRCDVAAGSFPCWRVEEKTVCKDLSPESLGVTIDRNGMQAPLDSFARVFCSTLAQ